MHGTICGVLSVVNRQAPESPILSVSCVYAKSRPFPSACGHKKYLYSIYLLTGLDIVRGGSIVVMYNKAL